ncbi:arylformamidase [Pontibacillus yanchengensis]|uniref:Arylformamidase n=1 Tax=Pontibacillus yanchengensis TaxID=462910 RepID=A0ACC7VID1_9BACI|nr:arylformamidase [Pontibacillus yanchengensis]MYL54440.1 arylformamidase [Pontibacillus yanchengensis]
MSIIDISRRLEQGTPTWPGDTPFSYSVSWSKEESGSVNVGKLEMSIHTGTHVDAPFHFMNNGERIYDLDPELYVGPALLIDVINLSSIAAKDIEQIDLTNVRRILFKTNSWTDYTTFPEEVTYIEADVAPYLAKHNIKLIGVDVPSVDPLDSKELQAHHALHTNHIHILEGLALHGVTAGWYELMALPLPIVEGDGSPVRAVLRSYQA